LNAFFGRPNLQGVRTFGGLITALLAVNLVLFIGDSIDWTADKSDTVGTAVALVAGIGGWVLGSRLVGRFRHRGHPPKQA